MVANMQLALEHLGRHSEQLLISLLSDYPLCGCFGIFWLIGVNALELQAGEGIHSFTTLFSAPYSDIFTLGTIFRGMRRCTRNLRIPSVSSRDSYFSAIVKVVGRESEIVSFSISFFL